MSHVQESTCIRGHMFQDPQQVPETTESTKPRICCFSYTYMPRIDFINQAQ